MANTELTPPDKSFLRRAAQQEGAVHPDHAYDTGRNKGFVLYGKRLVSFERFQRDGVHMLRFTITEEGATLLKQHA